jgi:hypothetical protein
MLRTIVQGSALCAVVLAVGAVNGGCLDRPVVANEPTIQTNFTTEVSESGVNKIDLLFDIDNSASMGDKQAYLVEAIPQMVARLVTPRCVDANGNPVVPAASADPLLGTCVTGAPEFAAVHDMHIGVVTSSLGSRLGIDSKDKNGTPTSYVCEPTYAVKSAAGVTTDAHNDDQGHLINRTQKFGVGPGLTNAALPEGGGFLAWFPALGNAGATAVTPTAGSYTTIGDAATPGTLVGDFSEVVNGAGESGCGIESQLESWYRFLIQPDPYAQLGFDANGRAQWQGVDTTILQQRHDFLRPDSLVAIIVLSDENDSEIDVRSYQGSGYNFMGRVYPPPQATQVCATDPTNGACTSCPPAAQCGAPNAPDACKDPGCTANEVNGVYTGVWPYGEGVTPNWGYDPNLRHVHMPQKYGLDPQFPLTRYWTGLTQATVPNRLGEYPSPTGPYVGTQSCVNPLFAASLPTGTGIADAAAVTPAEISTTLCHLPVPNPAAGPVRTAKDIFFAHIGGVPHELLQNNAVACKAAGCTGLATDAASCANDCAQKDTLTTSDWTSILGASAAAYTPSATGTFPPIAYDYTGIDPHMIEAASPRNQLTVTPASNPPASTLPGPAFGTGADPLRPDPISGREWITNVGAHSLDVDREFACIFQLPVASQRDCAAYSAASIEGNSCDCVPGGAWTSAGTPGPTGNADTEVPPLCSKTSTDGTITSAVNDYTVQTYAKAYPTIRELTLASMMGAQGIVSSLCPIHPTEVVTGDPLYGYRPAVNAIVDRLKSQLGGECVPKLARASADAGTSAGTVPCLVLVSFPPSVEPPGTSCASIGAAGTYVDPEADVLANFRATHQADGGASAAMALAGDVTCALHQVSVVPGATCANGGTPGWCYVTANEASDAGGVAGSTCTQQISFSSTNVVPSGATMNLQCVSHGGS